MMRATWSLISLRVLLLPSVGIAAVAKCGDDRDVKSQPNVVFVLADDLGLADIGYNAALATRGAVSTPVLDHLSEMGTIFTRFYANAVCTPTRAALMTGRFASRTNMKSPIALLDRATGLNEDEELLPEKMKGLGYMTHMVGKWHLGYFERKFVPVARGFDTFCGNLDGATDYFYHNFSPPFSLEHLPHDLHCARKVRTYEPDDWKDASLSNDGSDDYENSTEGSSNRSDQLPPASCTLASGGYYANDITSIHRYEVDFAQPASETGFPDEDTYGDYYTTNIYGRKSVEVIENHDPEDGPLFLFVSFTAPHSPLQALLSDFEGCDPEVIADGNRLVLCAMIKGMDRNVGYIVDALKSKDLWEDTVFVLASDNGAPTSFGGDNGPLRGEKSNFYEGGILTPAFIHLGENTSKGASASRGMENNQPINVVDLFSTFIGAGSRGIGTPSFKNDIDGRDLWPYLSEGKPIPAPLSDVDFSFAAGPGFLGGSPPRFFNDDGSFVEAVIATYKGKEYKLCRNCNGETEDEVFDLIADPFETTNLAGMPEHSGVITALDEILSSWVELAFPFQDPDTIPSLAEYAGDVLEGAGLDPALAESIVFDQRCALPLDSPEFLCTDCGALKLDFPWTAPADN